MKRVNVTQDIEVQMGRAKDLLEKRKVRERQHRNVVRNSPHMGGTVSELAERLGVSKSEVRRLKREGLIDQAIEDHNAEM